MKNKKTRRLKAIGFSSLALLMGIAGTLAFAPLSNAPVMPSSLSAGATAEGQNFDLGLRPDTDPVVYTTESGLEIKKSNGKYSSTTTVTTNKGFSYTQDLRNFYYFTMGSFSGTIYTAVDTTTTYTVTNEPVNWLIIGRGPGFNFEEATPAGTGIKTDRNKEEIATSALNLPNFFTTVPEHSDIPKGCFLVLSEKLLGQMYFNSSGAINTAWNESLDSEAASRIQGKDRYGDRYRYKSDSSLAYSDPGKATWNNKTDGSLYSYINSLFSKNTSGTILQNGLGFSQTQADMIIPQQLYTFYSNGEGCPRAETPSTDGGTYYTMFPLAMKNASTSTKQNFCVEDYLHSVNQRISCLVGSSNSYHWYLRSGNATLSGCARLVIANGYIGSWWGTNSLGVRPAMVMRLA